MNESSLWITPLLILPGVALLILSTSIRLNRLHDEVEHIVSEHHKATEKLLAGLLKRGRLFRDALISLYVAVALLAIAGLLGASFAFLGDTYILIPAGFTVLAVAVLVYSSVLLIKESRTSLGVIEAHIETHRSE